MVQKIKSAVLIILLFTSALSAQQVHRGGLLFEDITKSTFIKEYNPLKKISILPDFTDLSAFMPPVGNQGNQGSCVAWSMGYYTKSYQEYLERGWNLSDASHRFSPSFIYNQINQGVDSGSYFSDAVYLMMYSGCCVYSEQPYQESNFTSMPSAAAMDNALYFRVSSGYWLNTGVESGKKQLKQLLVEGKVATAGIYIWSNFDYIQNFNYIYCSNSRYGINRGGHAITIVGYDDSLLTQDGYGAFKFVNSWGTGWGKNGYGWISYKAMSDPMLSQQIAVFITDRIGYTPILKAKVKLQHNSRSNVRLNFSIVDQGLYYNYHEFTFPLKSYLNYAVPDQILTYDLTEMLTVMNVGRSSRILLNLADTKSDGYIGTLQSFTLEDIAGGQINSCTAVPHTIADFGGDSLGISITPKILAPRIFLSSPLNGEVEVSDQPVLFWKSSGSNMYEIQVSVNDNEFSSNIIFSGTVNTNSVQLPVLQRNQVYFWRVSNVNENNWSDIWSFKTKLLNSRIGFSPLKYGYEWKDISGTGKAIENWINIDSDNKIWTVSQQPAVKDDGYTSSKIPIGFQFDFYGQKFDSLYVGVNGLVSFTHEMLNTACEGHYTGDPYYLGAFSPDFFPPNGSFYPNSIAVAYDDFDLNKSDGFGSGNILYQTLNDRFILTWNNVGSFQALDDTSNSFQMILDKNDNSITINYKSFGKTATINNVKTGIQQCDTAGVMWYSSGTPYENRPGNNTAVKFIPVSTSDVTEDQVPSAFILLQNFPNPFNPATNIRFSIPAGQIVNVTVYNLLGQVITTLVDDYLNAGVYNYQWNAAGMPSGIYFCSVKAGSQSSVTKMLLLK